MMGTPLRNHWKVETEPQAAELAAPAAVKVAKVPSARVASTGCWVMAALAPTGEA